MASYLYNDNNKQFIKFPFNILNKISGIETDISQLNGATETLYTDIPTGIIGRIMTAFSPQEQSKILLYNKNILYFFEARITAELNYIQMYNNDRLIYPLRPFINNQNVGDTNTLITEYETISKQVDLNFFFTIIQQCIITDRQYITALEAKYNNIDTNISKSINRVLPRITDVPKRQIFQTEFDNIIQHYNKSTKNINNLQRTCIKKYNLYFKLPLQIYSDWAGLFTNYKRKRHVILTDSFSKYFNVLCDTYIVNNVATSKILNVIEKIGNKFKLLIVLALKQNIIDTQNPMYGVALSSNISELLDIIFKYYSIEYINDPDTQNAFDSIFQNVINALNLETTVSQISNVQKIKDKYYEILFNELHGICTRYIARNGNEDIDKYATNICQFIQNGLDDNNKIYMIYMLECYPNLAQQNTQQFVLPHNPPANPAVPPVVPPPANPAAPPVVPPLANPAAPAVPTPVVSDVEVSDVESDIEEETILAEPILIEAEYDVYDEPPARKIFFDIRNPTAIKNAIDSFGINKVAENIAEQFHSTQTPKILESMIVDDIDHFMFLVQDEIYSGYGKPSPNELWSQQPFRITLITKMLQENNLSPTSMYRNFVDAIGVRQYIIRFKSMLNGYKNIVDLTGQTFGAGLFFTSSMPIRSYILMKPTNVSEKLLYGLKTKNEQRITSSIIDIGTKMDAIFVDGGTNLYWYDNIELMKERIRELKK